FLSSYLHLPYLPSFPTRRSSDLFAESLLDGLAEALAATSSLTTRLRTEVRNWKLKRVSMGGFTLDREAQRFFLSSGSTLLRHALDRKSTRLNSSHVAISYAVFCL